MIIILKKFIDLVFIPVNWLFTLRCGLDDFTIGYLFCGLVVVFATYDLIAYLMNIKTKEED